MSASIKVTFVLIEVPEEDLDHPNPAQSIASRQIETIIRLLTPKHLPANPNIVLCDRSQRKTSGAAATWSLWRASHNEPRIHQLPLPLTLTDATRKLAQEYANKETLTVLVPTTDMKQFTSVLGLPTGKEDFPHDGLPYLTAICVFQLKPGQEPKIIEFFW